MAKVFVSYSRKDIEFAKRLTAELQKSELDFWIDWEGIPPTVDWWREIEKGIEEADVFIFLISPDSSASKVCGKEIDCAVKNAKRIIPLVVRDIKGDEVPTQLSHLNWIFFRESDDFDAAVKKLMTAIQTDYEWAATHRRLQIKALDWERNSKDNGFLLRGMDLLDAEQDLATNTSKDPHPTDLQREYVLASRKATDRQRRILTSISIAGVIALAALAVFALVKAGEATNNAAIAQAAQVTAESNASVARTAEAKAEDQAKISRAGELSAQSIALRDKDFQLSILLGIEAYNHLVTVQSKGALMDNAQSHPVLRNFLSGHESEVEGVAFSPDGKLLASGSENSIILWNTATGRPVGRSLTGYAGMKNVVFSPDGKTLAAASMDTTVLWNVATGKPIGQPLTRDNENSSSTGIAFSPDGKAVAVGNGSYTILWDVATGELMGQPLESPSNVWTVAFSPDGKILASGTYGSITLWEVATQRPLKELIPEGLLPGSEGIRSVAFSPDGKILASGGEDKTIRLWELATGKLIGQPFEGHTESVDSVAFSPDGKTLASGSLDATIILWDVVTGKPIGQPLTGHTDGVDSVAFSPDGKTLASGSWDTNIILWNVSMILNKKVTVSNPLAQHFAGHVEGLENIIFSPDGKTIASTVCGTPEDLNCISNEIILWNAATGKPLDQHLDQSYWISDIAFSPDGKALASAGCAKEVDYYCSQGGVILWDVVTGKRVGQYLVHSDWVRDISFSPNGKVLASAGCGKSVNRYTIANCIQGEIILWDVTTGKPVAQYLSNTPYLNGIAFSPDGKALASFGCKDPSFDCVRGEINLWDLAIGKSVDQFLGHTLYLTNIAFSPDGKILASAGCGKQYDGTCIQEEIILWDVATGKPSGQHLTIDMKNSGGVLVNFSPDGKTLLSRLENFLLLWDVESHQSIGQLIVGNSSRIWGVAFNADGKMLASVIHVKNSPDRFSDYSKNIILWEINPESWIEKSCKRAGRNFTRVEWERNGFTESYRKICDEWPLEPEANATPAP